MQDFKGFGLGFRPIVGAFGVLRLDFEFGVVERKVSGPSGFGNTACEGFPGEGFKAGRGLGRT